MANPLPVPSAFHACFLLLAASLTCGPLESAGGAETPGLRPGSVIELQGRTARLIKLDSLPVVESTWSKRFHFDPASNTKLKELRERYRQDEMTAAGKDEFDRQVLLMDWTHRQFKKFGRPSSPAKGAPDILSAIGQDHRFFCAQYAEVHVSTAASLGWINRPLALRRHQGVNKVGGSTEHSVTENWSRSIPEVDHARSHQQPVYRKSRRAAQRLRNPSGMVPAGRPGSGVCGGQGAPELPEGRSAHPAGAF